MRGIGPQLGGTVEGWVWPMVNENYFALLSTFLRGIVSFSFYEL
jgi:hypothetical protein